MNPFDRMNLGLSNLLGGDIQGAGTSVLAPANLAPSQRISVAERTGMDSNVFLSTLANTVGNPLFLAGILASIKYPIAKADKLYTYRENVVNESKRLGLLSKLASPVQTQFANVYVPGTKKTLPDTMLEMGFKVEQFKNKHTQAIIDAYEDFMRSTGMAEMPADSQRKIAAYLDGLWDANNPNMVTVLGKGMRPLMRDPAKVMSAPELKFAQKVRGTLDTIYNEMYEELPSAKAAVQEVLQRKLVKLGKVGKTFNITTVKKALIDNFEDLPAKTKESIQLLRSKDAWGKVTTYQQIANLLTKGGMLEKDSFVTKQAKASIIEALRSKGIDIPDSIQFQKNYFPHVMRITQQDYERYLNSLLEATEGSRAKGGALNLARAKNVLSPAALPRNGMMIPDIMDLERLADLGVVDRGVLNALEKRVKWDSTAKRFSEDAPDYIRQYSLRAEPVLSKYVNDSANQHVWTGLGYGKRIVETTKTLDVVGQNMMKDTYIPQLMGKLTDRQAMQSMEWAQNRDKWLLSLREGKGWAAYLPANMRKTLSNQIMDYSGPITWQGVSGKLAGYFYSTTLGLNPGSAIKNVLQTFLTLMPQVGIDSTLSGMREAANKLKQYSTIRAQGVGKEKAWGRVFKDFEEAGLSVTPLTKQLSRGYVEDAYDIAQKKVLGLKSLTSGSKGVKLKTMTSKINEVMMGMFQTTEQWNRLVAFYTGKSKYLKDVPNAPKQEVLQFARNVVLNTQFPAGPGQSPYGIANLGPLGKQFLHFPLRFMGSLLTSTAQPYTKGGITQFSKAFNLGTIGRTVAISTAVYQLGKELFDTDLSGGLMFGALPLPQMEDSPFYPFPVVPPAASLLGSAAQSLLTGDPKAMKYASSLLVPGGIMGRRAMKVLPAEYGGYADYNNRTPDGRIPLYTESGSLKGYKTPMDLIGGVVGFGDMTGKNESEMMDYIVKQRDRIRSYRRQYLEAIYQNDFQTAKSINEGFKTDMPGLGDIVIKRGDLKALEVRKNMTRLERTLNTIPKEYREEYRQMISRVMGIEAVKMQGTDPSLMQPMDIVQPNQGYGDQRNMNIKTGGTMGTTPISDFLGRPSMLNPSLSVWNSGGVGASSGRLPLGYPL